MRHYERGAKTRSLILAFIRIYIEDHGYAPSNKEISDAIQVSPTSVWQHMNILLAQGDLETDLPDRWHTSRAYRLRR